MDKHAKARKKRKSSAQSAAERLSTDKVSGKKAVELLNRQGADIKIFQPVSFYHFLDLLSEKPSWIIRNVFQTFYDMMKSHVDVIDDSIADDPEEFNFTDYDCSRLFVEGSENPYFTDRLFANRLMKHMEGLRHGAQQNRIYIFYGPHGCGKSTFLNNLLKKFEQYANTDKGMRYEVLWRLDVKKLGGGGRVETVSAIEKLVSLLETSGNGDPAMTVTPEFLHGHDKEVIEIPCLSHDNPLLVVPADQRRDLLDRLIKNDEVMLRLVTENQDERVAMEEDSPVCVAL